MIILALRTDKPEAELYLYEDKTQMAALKWQAHLRLAETLNTKIEKLLNKLSISYSDLGGIAIYKGPGSFTGLRIGITTANALAYSLDIPVVARGQADWLKRAIDGLLAGQTDQIALPEYGAPVRTTQPKK